MVHSPDAYEEAAEDGRPSQTQAQSPRDGQLWESTYPNPMIHPLPTALRWWPPKFIVNQHTMMGIAEYVPLVTRNNIPYMTEVL
jgi:hypothetical protein